MIIGIILIVLVFEAGRRVMGIALPTICAIFLAYGLFGEYLPGDFAHRGYGFDQIVNQLSFGTEGFYGTPTYVSARSEEHTSELQSRENLVCRLLLEKKK